MADGTASTNLPLASFADEVLVNNNPGTGMEGPKRFPIAQAAAQISALVSLADAVMAIVTRSLSTPPGAPTIGDRYVVGAAATGAWAGKEKQIATWEGTAWTFIVPTAKSTVKVIDESAFYTWSAADSDWVIMLGDALVFATWAALDTVTGTRQGQRAEVNGDVGTHTDAWGLAGVSNSGVFSWDTTAPSGWRRMADSTYATLASPAFTGNPTAPTPGAGDNDISIATTAYVQAELVSGLGAYVQGATRAPFEVATVDPVGWASDDSPAAHGYQFGFGIGDCETLLLGIDSITESYYTLKDKGYPSLVSARGNYRVQNLGISGYDLEEWYSHLADNYLWNGAANIYVQNGWTFDQAKHAKLAVIMSWANEIQNTADWLRGAKKVVALLRSVGANVAIMTESYIGANAQSHTTAANFAANVGAEVINAYGVLEPELKIISGPLTDGTHQGTRIAPLYASRTLEWLKRQPGPLRSIKLYNLRTTVTVSSLADLVFDGTSDGIFEKFKEISVAHAHVTEPEFFEEFDKHSWGVLTQFQRDQYGVLADGGSLSGTAYMLSRIAIPAEARGLEGVAVKLPGDATNYYVFDFFGNNTVGSDTPTGEWTAITPVNGVLRFDSRLLYRVMQGNEIFILSFKSGGQTIGGARVFYTPKPGHQVTQRFVRKFVPQSLNTQWSGDTLTGWTTVAGAPAILVPWDRPYGIPRAVGSSSAIAAVIHLMAGAKISRALTLPTAPPTGFSKEMRVRVWGRYAPKAYLDNDLYAPPFDAAQVIDRTGKTVAADSPINFETHDRVRLKMGAQIIASTSHETLWLDSYWTPVDFPLSVIWSAFPGSVTLSFEALDNDIEIARVDILEGYEDVHRA